MILTKKNFEECYNNHKDLLRNSSKEKTQNSQNTFYTTNY